MDTGCERCGSCQIENAPRYPWRQVKHVDLNTVAKGLQQYPADQGKRQCSEFHVSRHAPEEHSKEFSNFGGFINDLYLQKTHSIAYVLLQTALVFLSKDVEPMYSSRKHDDAQLGAL